jgi:hypothetical protein
MTAWLAEHADDLASTVPNVRKAPGRIDQRLATLVGGSQSPLWELPP